MNHIDVTILEWDEKAGKIIMVDDEGNNYILEKIMPSDGKNYLNIIQNDYYALGELTRNGEYIGLWVLRSKDKRKGYLVKYQGNHLT